MDIQDARPKFKRKQYLIAKKFQLKYVGLILALMFMTAALCSYVVYYTSMLLFGEKLANVYPQGRLVSIVNIVNFRILLSVILISPLVALIGIFLSHRIAGPVYRMEKFLNDMAAGNLSSRITLRQGDELQHLADGINNLVDNMKAIVHDQKDRMAKISGEVEGLKKLAESRPKDAAVINASIKTLNEEVNAICRVLDNYKL